MKPAGAVEACFWLFIKGLLQKLNQALVRMQQAHGGVCFAPVCHLIPDPSAPGNSDRKAAGIFYLAASRASLVDFVIRAFMKLVV
jgi:hypothetical protein